MNDMLTLQYHFADRGAIDISIIPNTVRKHPGCERGDRRNCIAVSAVRAVGIPQNMLYAVTLCGALSDF